MDINNKNLLEPLNEVYYGKTSNLKKIEKLLPKVIEYCKLVYNGKANIDINETKEVNEIKNLFTKEFNIGEFDLTFYLIHIPNLIGALGPNAFTMPSALQYFKKSSENKKVVDPSSSYIGVNVDIALVVVLDLTPEELMAVILHEIGHCMNASIFTLLARIPGTKAFKNLLNDNIAIFEKVKSLVSYGISLIFGKTINKGINSFFKWINSIISENNEFAYIIKQFFIYIDQLLNVIAPFLRISNIINNPLHYLSRFIDPSNLFNYQGEKFADSFATTYGYGVGIASFVTKWQNNEGSIIKEINQEIPAFAIGRDLADVSANIVTMLADPHPSDPSRAISQLNKMKRDINDPNLNPKIRSELQYNIDRLESIINDELLNPEKYKNSKNGSSPVKLFYNMLVIKVFKGKMDPRELLNFNNKYEL